MKSHGLSAADLTWKWHERNDFRVRKIDIHRLHVDFFPRRFAALLLPLYVFIEMKIENEEQDDSRLKRVRDF
jgi:hypothetical protein